MENNKKIESIVLKPVNEENFLDIFELKLRNDQDRFVSHPIRSLAQAYVYRNQCQPFGIYCGDTCVGYVMVIFDDEIPEYDIWHMMIDDQYQGQGFGKAAMKACLNYIKGKPLGNSERIILTCHEDNEPALKLYKGIGFSETGQKYDDEIELIFSAE